MAMTTRQIKAAFPETMSSTMLMKALGVSGQKMRWILEQGYIPHNHDDRKTHCYIIPREAVIAYLKDRKKHPDKYPIPAGCFSTRNPHPGTKLRITETTLDPVMLQKYLRFKWAKKPRILSLPAVSELLGYRTVTLHGWCAEGLLEIFSISGKPLVAKDDLIHCIAMRKMQLRPSHSEKHRKLMEGFAPFMEARQAKKA